MMANQPISDPIDVNLCKVSMNGEAIDIEEQGPTSGKVGDLAIKKEDLL